MRTVNDHTNRVDVLDFHDAHLFRSSRFRPLYSHAESSMARFCSSNGTGLDFEGGFDGKDPNNLRSFTYDRVFEDVQDRV